MVTKISKASVMGLLGGFLVVLSITGCGMLVLVMPTKTKSFTITGVEYDEAFSKAIRAAMEIDFGVSPFGGTSPDKSSGTFSASRGVGFVEATEMNFFLEKGTQGRLSFMVRVESSKGSGGVIEEFVAAYGKYVKITP